MRPLSGFELNLCVGRLADVLGLPRWAVDWDVLCDNAVELEANGTKLPGAPAGGKAGERGEEEGAEKEEEGAEKRGDRRRGARGRGPKRPPAREESACADGCAAGHAQWMASGAFVAARAWMRWRAAALSSAASPTQMRSCPLEPCVGKEWLRELCVEWASRKTPWLLCDPDPFSETRRFAGTEDEHARTVEILSRAAWSTVRASLDAETATELCFLATLCAHASAPQGTAEFPVWTPFVRQPGLASACVLSFLLGKAASRFAAAKWSRLVLSHEEGAGGEEEGRGETRVLETFSPSRRFRGIFGRCASKAGPSTSDLDGFPAEWDAAVRWRPGIDFPAVAVGLEQGVYDAISAAAAAAGATPRPFCLISPGGGGPPQPLAAVVRTGCARGAGQLGWPRAVFVAAGGVAPKDGEGFRAAGGPLPSPRIAVSRQVGDGSLPPRLVVHARRRA